MKTDVMLSKDMPVYAGLSEGEQLIVRHHAEPMLEAFDGGAWALARNIWEEIQANLSLDLQMAVWEFLGSARSRERAYLKGDDRKYLQDDG